MSLAVVVVAGLALGPTGFYQFCAEQPGQCIAAFGVVPTIALADTVNRQVNAIVRPQREIGRADVWKIGGPTGDCEDYALAKRAALIAAGVASSAARLAIGFTYSGERHAVLVVTTTGGDFVLDNLTDQLRPVSRATLRLDAIQSAENPRLWQRVKR